MFIIAALLSIVWITVCAMGCARQWEVNSARAALARAEASREPSAQPAATAAGRVQLIIPCDDIMYATGIPVHRTKEE